MKAKHLKPHKKKRATLKNTLLAIVLSFSLTICLTLSSSPTYSWMFTAPVNDGLKFSKATLSVSLAGVAGNQLIPGNEYTLSTPPSATVAKGNVSCYLFVKVTVANDYYEYTMADGWKQYSSTAIWYWKDAINPSSAAVTKNILASDKVKIKTGVTLPSNGTLAASKITFTSCAVQSGGSIGIDNAYKEAATILA